MIINGKYNNIFIITPNAHKVLKEHENYDLHYSPDNMYICRCIIMNGAIRLGHDFDYFCFNPNQNYNQFAIQLNDNKYPDMFSMLANTSCIIDAMIDEDDGKSYSLYITIRKNDYGLSIDMKTVTLKISNSFLSIHDITAVNLRLMNQVEVSDCYSFVPIEGVKVSKFSTNLKDLNFDYTTQMRKYRCIAISPSTGDLVIENENIDRSYLRLFLTFEYKVILSLDAEIDDDGNYIITLNDISKKEEKYD